jgi:hypothetical protein
MSQYFGERYYLLNRTSFTNEIKEKHEMDKHHKLNTNTLIQYSVTVNRVNLIQNLLKTIFLKMTLKYNPQKYN